YSAIRGRSGYAWLAVRSTPDRPAADGAGSRASFAPTDPPTTDATTTARRGRWASLLRRRIVTLYYVTVRPPSKPYDRAMQPDDEIFRARLREIVERSGLSLRQASLAMGRDVGYVAAILDPSRPSRARPTPDDLVRLSDATGVPLVDLLEQLWGIDPKRLTRE